MTNRITREKMRTFWQLCLGSWRIHLFVIAGFAVAVASVELGMGRLLICKSGEVLLWYGNTYGSGNSQHLSDWYTFSHNHSRHDFLRNPLGSRRAGCRQRADCCLPC